MAWRRVRNFDGGWGYCKKCGHKAYVASYQPYSICADTCGYIETYRGVTYNSKNVLKIEVKE